MFRAIETRLLVVIRFDESSEMEYRIYVVL